MPESAEERQNRELIELLNELRVALPGVQVLFAFLLAVPFALGAVIYLCSLISPPLPAPVGNALTAIPLLLIHSFLQNKTNAIVESLEIAMVKFLNMLEDRPEREARPAPEARSAPREMVAKA